MLTGARSAGIGGCTILDRWKVAGTTLVRGDLVVLWPGV